MCKCTVIIKADIIKGLSYCYYANVRDYHRCIISVAGILIFSDKLHLLSLKVVEVPPQSYVAIFFWVPVALGPGEGLMIMC